MAAIGESTRAVRMPRNERRRQLLDAAREVFVNVGFHAAAMDDIAVRAGVTKPVLYQHFPSKSELYIALLSAGAGTLVDAVSVALQSTTDNKQRVAATVAAYFDFVDDPDGAFRLVFESDLVNEPAVRVRTEEVTWQCAELLTDVIAEDAHLGRAEAHLLAVGLTGLIQVSARSWLTSDPRIPKDVAISLTASLAWRGIRGFPRP